MRFVREGIVLAALVGIAAAVAFAWPGRPSGAPPKPPDAMHPPPAWIETQTTSRWLAYGSYCWHSRPGRAACVDMLPPATRPGLPMLRTARAVGIRVHMAFRATTVSISVGGKAVAAKLDASRRVLSWQANRAGVLVIDVRGVGGDASYVGRLQL
jgi:hypothetical protein